MGALWNGLGLAAACVVAAVAVWACTAKDVAIREYDPETGKPIRDIRYRRVELKPPVKLDPGQILEPFPGWELLPNPNIPDGTKPVVVPGTNPPKPGITIPNEPGKVYPIEPGPRNSAASTAASASFDAEIVREGSAWIAVLYNNPHPLEGVDQWTDVVSYEYNPALNSETTVSKSFQRLAGVMSEYGLVHFGSAGAPQGSIVLARIKETETGEVYEVPFFQYDIDGVSGFTAALNYK